MFHRGQYKYWNHMESSDCETAAAEGENKYIFFETSPQYVEK